MTGRRICSVSHNLALLPADIRSEIERDKKRWHLAWVMTRNRDPRWIRQWLSAIEDQQERDDWRHRLNTLRQKGYTYRLGKTGEVKCR